MNLFCIDVSQHAINILTIFSAKMAEKIEVHFFRQNGRKNRSPFLFRHCGVTKMVYVFLTRDALNKQRRSLTIGIDDGRSITHGAL